MRRADVLYTGSDCSQQSWSLLAKVVPPRLVVRGRGSILCAHEHSACIRGQHDMQLAPIGPAVQGTRPSLPRKTFCCKSCFLSRRKSMISGIAYDRPSHLCFCSISTALSRPSGGVIRDSYASAARARDARSRPAAPLDAFGGDISPQHVRGRAGSALSTCLHEHLGHFLLFDP